MRVGGLPSVGSLHQTRSRTPVQARVESRGPRSLRPSLSCLNPLRGVEENGGPEIGSDLSGSWRPGCHRECPDSLFKALRCDSGIFLPLIKRQTSPSSSLPRNHKYPSRFEWEKQGHSLPSTSFPALVAFGDTWRLSQSTLQGLGLLGPSYDSLGTVL